MPFIGQQPITGAYSVLDDITTSATATYNLQLNSAAYSPASANNLLVSLNGVIQKPGSSFTISGSQITFSSALTSSDSIDFIIALGDVLSVGTPTDGSVSTASLAPSAVTDAKISGMASSKLTGALPAISGASITDMGMVKLASVTSTSAVSSVQISTDYSGYNNFRLCMSINGDSSTSSEARMTWKRAGQSSFDTGTNYGFQTILIDTASNLNNNNGTGTFVKFFGEPDQPPNRGFGVDMWLNGFGSTTFFSTMHGMSTVGGIAGSYGTWVLGGAYNTNTLARERIVELNLAFSNGNISEIHYQLYGMKV